MYPVTNLHRNGSLNLRLINRMVTIENRDQPWNFVSTLMLSRHALKFELKFVLLKKSSVCAWSNDAMFHSPNFNLKNGSFGQNIMCKKNNPSFLRRLTKIPIQKGLFDLHNLGKQNLNYEMHEDDRVISAILFDLKT